MDYDIPTIFLFSNITIILGFKRLEVPPSTSILCILRKLKLNFNEKNINEMKEATKTDQC